MDRHVIFSQPTLAFTVAACALVGLRMTWVCIVSQTDRKDRDAVDMPAPDSKIPFFRNTFDIIRNYTTLHDWMLAQSEKHHWKIWSYQLMGLPPTAVVCSPEMVQDVLKVHADTIGKGERFTANIEDTIGHSLFSVDGPEWARQRKITSNLFSIKMLREKMQVIAKKHTESLCEHLAKLQQTRASVDVKDVMDTLTTNVFLEVGFGIDGKELETVNQAFKVSLTRYDATLFRREFMPVWMWKSLRFFRIGLEGQVVHDVEFLTNFAKNVVAQSIMNKSKYQEDEDRPMDLVSLLVKHIDLTDDQQLDTELIRNIAITFLAASRSTTASSLSWFILMMNRHPHVLAKIRQEMREKLPGLLTGEIAIPSMEQLQVLPYLEAAIRENLRMNPVAPGLQRNVLEDTVLSDGTLLKKGTPVFFPIYAMCRSKREWGEDAASFKPERWINSTTGELETVSQYKFLAFGGGARVCIGQRLAMMELKVALASIVSRFDLEPERDPSSYAYSTAGIMSVNGPLNVTVTSAKV